MHTIVPLLKTSSHPLRIAITGGIHVGKTTALNHIYRTCLQQGMDISGILEIAIFDDERRIGYDFVDLVTGQSCAVARKTSPPSDHVQPPYAFFDEAWVWAGSRLRASETHTICMIDELGRLEANRCGWMPLLLPSLCAHPRHLIAGVRKDVLPKIESQLGGFDKIIELH